MTTTYAPPMSHMRASVRLASLMRLLAKTTRLQTRCPDCGIVLRPADDMGRCGQYVIRTCPICTTTHTHHIRSAS